MGVAGYIYLMKHILSTTAVVLFVAAGVLLLPLLFLLSPRELGELPLRRWDK